MRKSLALLLLVVFGLLLVSTGHAEEKEHPIDVQLEKLLDKNPSTLGQLQALAQGYDLWDKELNRVYRTLKKELAHQEMDNVALTTAQRNWITYRDSHFEALKKFYQGFQGTMYRPMHAYDRMAFVRTRVLQLSDMLMTVKELR